MGYIGLAAVLITSSDQVTSKTGLLITGVILSKCYHNLLRYAPLGLNQSLTVLAGSRHFSTHHVVSRYWQFPLTEMHEKFPPFLSVVPYETIKPATFEQDMEKVMQ